MTKWIALAALAAATMVTEANAAKITYSSPSQGPTTLQQFDPTLGKLNSAQVYTYYYFSNQYAIPGSFQTNGPEIHVKGTIGDSAFGLIAFDRYIQSLRDTTEQVSIYFAADKQTLFAGDVSRFVGTGSLAVPVSISFDFVADGYFDRLLQVNTLSSAGVTYDYTPFATAVPEPATWAMMLIGFGMIGATARYRRRSMTTTYA